MSADHALDADRTELFRAADDVIGTMALLTVGIQRLGHRLTAIPLHTEPDHHTAAELQALEELLSSAVKTVQRCTDLLPESATPTAFTMREALTQIVRDEQ
jgi:hypothetical protein